MPARFLTFFAALILTALALPALSQAAGDPVQESIARSLATGQLTFPQAQDLQATWKRSAAARDRLAKAGQSQRAAQVIGARMQVLEMAKGGHLSAQRMEPAMLSIKATTQVMLSESYPSNEQKIVIPGEVASFRFYNGRGVQYQPFDTFKDGMARATWKGDHQGARVIADRLLELSVSRGGSLTWEYYFEFEGTTAQVPWASSISQALAVEFFQLVAAQSPSGEGQPYAIAADQSLALFENSPSQGGVSVPQGAGSWYLLYSHHPSQRVLNGHLQVLVSLIHYQKMVKSARAAAIVERGTVAVLPLLPSFDTGGWSRYQLGAEADLGYHDFQTSQLQKLGRLTGQAEFAAYGNRFKLYRQTPPAAADATPAQPAILPATDDLRDTAQLSWKVSRRTSDRIVIRSAAGAAVRILQTSGSAGEHIETWDGRNTHGQVVKEGAYSAKVTSTDIAGHSTTIAIKQPLLVALDHTPPQVFAVKLSAAGASASLVTGRYRDSQSGYVTVMVRQGSHTLALSKVARGSRISIKLALPASKLRGAKLIVIDTSHNHATATLQLNPALGPTGALH